MHVGTLLAKLVAKVTRRYTLHVPDVISVWQHDTGQALAVLPRYLQLLSSPL